MSYLIILGLGGVLKCYPVLLAPKAFLLKILFIFLQLCLLESAYPTTLVQNLIFSTSVYETITDHNEPSLN